MGNVLIDRNTMGSIASSIRTKGGSTGGLKPGNMPEAILNIPQGRSKADPDKEVCFFSFDGELLYSFSETELNQLTELPTPPNVNGLICQGWNWTLEQLQMQSNFADVAPMYITDDGSTRIYIELLEGRTAPVISFMQSKANGVLIDWGDGSTPATSGAVGVAVNMAHEYLNEGSYVIRLTPDEDTFLTIRGTNKHGGELVYWNKTIRDYNRLYHGVVKAVELGKNIVLGDYAFADYASLETLTVPDYITSVGTCLVDNCYALKMIVLPKLVTEIPSAMAAYCYKLQHASLPYGVERIKNQAFLYCHSMDRISLPKSVTTLEAQIFDSCSNVRTISFPEGISQIPDNCCNRMENLEELRLSNGLQSIGKYAFAECYKLAKIIIPATVTSLGDCAFNNGIYRSVFMFPEVPPALTASFAFLGIQSDAKIYVPAESLETYQNATYWSDRKSYLAGM